MPTYTFTTTSELSHEQRKKLVASVTDIHSVEVNAPRFFVQVVFYVVDAGAMFVGGKPAPEGHVWVNSLIRAGRTRQQKESILLRIMQETSEILHILAEDVWVYISDIPAEAVAEYGAVLPQPGDEQLWLTSLPTTLQKKLRAML